MVLVAIIATLWVALSQPDQSATTKTESRRTPRPEAVPPAPTAEPDLAAAEAVPQATRRRGRTVPSPVTMTPAMPGGFQWMEASPVPRFRAGFALVVLLAVVAALLAVTVAGVVLGISVAVRGALA